MFVYIFFLQFGDQILHKHPVFTMFTGDKDILGPRITSPLCGPRKALMNDATWFGGSHSEKYLLFQRLKMHPAAAGCMKRLSGMIYDLFKVVFTAKMSPCDLLRSVELWELAQLALLGAFWRELEEIHGCSPDISTGYASNMFYFHPENWGFMIQFDLRIFFFRWVGSAEPATRCILLYSWLPWLKEGCNMEMKQIWDRSNGQWDDYIRWFFISFCWDSWKNHPEFMVHGIELGGFSFHWFQAKIRTEQEVVITASWECSSDQFTLVTCCI